MAMSRFQIPEGELPSFLPQAELAARFFSERPGCLGAELVRNLDDPQLWALVSRWENVGAYRRAFQGMDAKMTLTPVLSRAVDEPSAYADPAEVGTNRPRAR